MPAPKGNQYAKGHHCGRPVEWTDEKITEEAAYLLEWSQDSDALVLGECYGSRGYSYEDAIEWAEKHEVFRKSRLLAKSIVGARREKGAIKGKYGENLISKTMALYDPEYKALMKELKNAQTIVNVAGDDAAKKLSEVLKSQPQVSK